jgi:hypothetical protein
VNTSPSNSAQPAELSNAQVGSTGGYGDSELSQPDLDADLIPDLQPIPKQ